MTMAMSSFDTLIQDLVIANRILAKEDVVDAYGHVSVRHPDNPRHFLIARSVAPELVTTADIIELDLDGQPVRDEKRTLYLERFIHAAILSLAGASKKPGSLSATRLVEQMKMVAGVGLQVMRHISPSYDSVAGSIHFCPATS
jgi:hypothetical protein